MGEGDGDDTARQESWGDSVSMQGKSKDSREGYGMGEAKSHEEIGLMFSVNRQLVRRAEKEWDKCGEGYFTCFLLKFVHFWWVGKARWN